jgi:hypothetical protein
LGGDLLVAKVTLSVDHRVVSLAMEYAKRRGVSLSELVEAYLAAVADPPSPVRGDASILRSIRVILKNANVNDYREHLAVKYR